MADLATRISALQDELENLRRQKVIEDAEAAKLSPEQTLAIQMHAALRLFQFMSTEVR